jgi:hypothetical protein
VLYWFKILSQDCFAAACRRPYFCLGKSKQNHVWRKTRHPWLKQLRHRIPAKKKSKAI